MKKKTVISCLLGALFLAGAAGATPALTAHANSAPPYWEGTTSTGAIVTGEQCPIEVERELLTLNIPALPQNSYSSQEEFEEYLASVTAEYTFYNPTDMDVEMDLAFPFGSRPRYAYAGYDAESGESEYFDDTARYQITADGEAVEREVRYTYQPYSFDVESMYLISDEKRENDFFTPDLSVTRYTYTVDYPRGVDDGTAEFVFKFDPARTRILCQSYRAFNTGEDGEVHLFLYAHKQYNATFGFTVAGEAPEEITSRVIKSGAGYWTDAATLPGAAVREVSTEETTLGEYVESARPEGIGEVDFYNGYLDWLSTYIKSSYYGSVGLYGAEPEGLRMDDFMRWYTYSLKIPAGQRLVNSVTAPLYPTIDYQACEYEYLLSPAKKWAAFGELEIVINTDLEIYASSLEFTQTEGGYTLYCEGLPDGELTFTILGDYDYHSSGWGYVLLVIVIIVFVALVAVAVLPHIVAGIVLGIVFGVRRAKKKKQNK